MQVLRTRSQLRGVTQELKAQGRRIGFVPTMGALHEGHLSLVDIAKDHSDVTIVSIFVNPAQFAPHEDLETYPRDEDGDLEQLKACGVDIVYIPGAEEMYPSGNMNTDIKAGAAGQGLETDFRPHFFDGVVNVVARLFDHVRPDVSVFGEKDYQQLMVIREMVEAQDMKIEVLGGAIIRDERGLALSSRNAYLSQEELKTARQFNAILKAAAQNEDLDTARSALKNVGFDKIDYIENRWGRVLGAGWVGKTRLIDNIAS